MTDWPLPRYMCGGCWFFFPSAEDRDAHMDDNGKCPLVNLVGDLDDWNREATDNHDQDQLSEAA